MRRLLLLCLAVGLLISGTFLVSFTFSRYRVAGQSYLASLGDFVFMIDSYRRQSLEVPAPPLDDARYAALMERFREHTHGEVERRILWRLAQWGPTVVPRLAAELRADAPWPRAEGAIRALGAIGGEPAVAPLGEFLCAQPHETRSATRVRVRRLVEALGDTRHPSAASWLSRCAAQRVVAGEIDASAYHDALGESGGGAGELLAAFEASDDPDEVYEMLWALAATRDARVARAMAPLLLHPLSRVRRLTRDALDQSMGPAAVDPVLDVMEGTRDGFVIVTVVEHLLDDRDARDNPRVVPALSALLDQPALASVASYALARLGGPAAVSALRRHARDDPEAALDHVEMLGEAGLPIVADALASADADLRWTALDKAVQIYTPGARQLVEPLTRDPDPRIARDATRALLRLDKVALHKSWSDSLPGDLARQAWLGLRPHWFGFDTGIERMWPVLTGVHTAGVLLSALLAVLLAFKALALFEPYRFQVFVLFLLAEGFVGDFFFMDRGADPWLRYQQATGVHLLLLIGFLCLPRDTVPGELRGRFESLGGASVWLLAPVLLLFGTPTFAQALRTSFSDYANLRPWLWLLALLTGLVFEQWLVPWHRFPRRAVVERAARAALSAVVLAMLGLALVDLSGRRRAAGDADGAWLAIVLTLPLAYLLAVHLHSLGLTRGARAPRLAPAPGRLRVLQDGESARVRLAPRRRSAAARALRTVLVLGPAAVAGVVSGGSGKATGMLLAFVAAPLGAALGALAVLLLQAPLVVEIRRGWMRSSRTLLGASPGRAAWRRRLPRRGAGSTSAWPDLEPEEAAWLGDVLAGGTGAAPSGAQAAPDLALELKPAGRLVPGSRLVSLQLDVTNRGPHPVSPAQLDERAGGLSWRARCGAESVPLFLSRDERESRILPGGRVVLRPRVDLGSLGSGRVPLRVTCPAGASNEIRLDLGAGP